MLKSLVTVSRVTFSAGHTGNLKSREKIWRTKNKKQKKEKKDCMDRKGRIRTREKFQAPGEACVTIL